MLPPEFSAGEKQAYIFLGMALAIFLLSFLANKLSRGLCSYLRWLASTFVILGFIVFDMYIFRGVLVDKHTIFSFVAPVLILSSAVWWAGIFIPNRKKYSKAKRRYTR